MILATWLLTILGSARKTLTKRHHKSQSKKNVLIKNLFTSQTIIIQVFNIVKQVILSA